MVLYEVFVTTEADYQVLLDLAAQEDIMHMPVPDNLAIMVHTPEAVGAMALVLAEHSINFMVDSYPGPGVAAPPGSPASTSSSSAGSEAGR